RDRARRARHARGAGRSAQGTHLVRRRGAAAPARAVRDGRGRVRARAGGFDGARGAGRAQHHRRGGRVSAEALDHRATRADGRDFANSDAPGALPVAIVNQKLAHRWWPNASALGQTLTLERDQPRGEKQATSLTIVGVAADVQYDWTSNAAEPVIYVSYRQAP